MPQSTREPSDVSGAEGVSLKRRWLNHEEVTPEQADRVLKSIAHVLSSLSLHTAADQVPPLLLTSLTPRSPRLQVAALRVQLMGTGAAAVAAAVPTGGVGTANALFDQLDTNGDGVVDRAEFSQLEAAVHTTVCCAPSPHLTIRFLGAARQHWRPRPRGGAS